ncbi:MAG: preprotein translocase subunit SecA, partial [Candidatus Sungbacteria bacterium]|nr:preprotein translocase subunit SecA [Candidatus Sungbacteria bacterium]
DMLSEAFAAVRVAASRALDKRHFDVQLIGGIVLHQGKIAEMKTGEGKTLVATLPLYLNSLAGRGVHLITPNDYLSRVGAGWMGPVYHALGATVAVIAHDFSGMYDPTFEDPHPHGDSRLNHFRPVTRHEAYAADITYGTNNELGFDYLRDNLEYDPRVLRQREHAFAIVDEVDSILIDEARTPLIISAPDTESGTLYDTFAKLVPQLKEKDDYNVDEKFKAVTITEAGIDKVERLLGVANIYEEKGIRFVRHLESALRAHTLFFRDRNYVVKDGAVIIVDEFTGRLMPGRRWSEGLHQAVEAKEGVAVQQESRTLATITFQNYFRMYGKLAGMTGTAQTSAEEFHKVYGLDVITIPTHRPMVRDDRGDLIFRSERGKFQAVVREVKALSQKGQPVLIGTVSIEKSERLSRMLEIEGVRHSVLNAKNHEQEALIIAQAGQKGAVTVATNMAGRGVDIILGGSEPDPRDAEEVRRVGGLHVIGTERHEARRIDNQLRGRAGRQGDPGASQFFVSLEDDLMRVFGSEKIKRMMEVLGLPEDEAIENRVVSRSIESAQGKIEGLHFDSRKQVLEYDDVLSKQRVAVYRRRRDILFTSEAAWLKEHIAEMITEEVRRIVDFHTAGDEWNLEEIAENIKAIADVAEPVGERLRELAAGQGDDTEKRDALAGFLQETLRRAYDAREKGMGEEVMREMARSTLLRSIDALWMDHLDEMEHLRDSVRLRAYGQRDPLVEYKNEGSRMYRELQAAIRSQVVQTIFKAGGHIHSDIPQKVEERRPDVTFGPLPVMPEKSISPILSQINASEGVKKTSAPEIGRNDPCPCGKINLETGRPMKYKKCCYPKFG